MPTPTVARPNAHVKLSDDLRAQMHGETLVIQYRNMLQSALDLADAIKVAKLVLAHAAYCGIDLGAAADDVAEMDYDEATDFRPIFA